MKIHKLIRCMILATVCLFGVAQGAALKDWSSLFDALTKSNFTTKTEHGGSIWNLYTSSTALKDFEGATQTDIQNFFDTLLEKLQLTSRSDGFFSTDRTELTWQQVDSLITLLNDQKIKNFITTKLPKITINQRQESTENFLSNLFFSLKAQLQIHTNELKTNYISQNSANFIIQGAWEGKASSSKSDSAGTTVSGGGPVIGRVSFSDNLLKSGPATTPPLSPHVQPKDEPAAAPHADKKIKTTKELKDNNERLNKAVADAQQELDAARQAAQGKKDAAIKLAESHLADARKFDQKFQEDLEKAQKAFDTATQKVTTAKAKKEQAEKNLAANNAGPAASPAGGGTPLENLNASLTALKAKLAQLGQSLQALQSGKPIPTPAPKAAVDKAALEQALNDTKAALAAAKADQAAAQKELTEAEKKNPAGTSIIKQSEEDLAKAQAININEDPAVIAAQKTLTEAQEKLSKWQAKHAKQKSSATPKKHPKKYTLKHLGKSKGTEDLPKSLKSSHEPKKVKEAGDATENKFNADDSKQWLNNLTLKDQATQNLKEARALLKEAKAVPGLNIQNKKKVTQARKHAQQAIREAVAAQTGNLKTFATKAQAAKEAAEHAKKLTTQAGPRRASKKAQIEPTLQEARDTLARAKGIADVQNDTTVQQALAAAQTAIQEAAQAHAGTKTKAFRIKAAAALKNAQEAETAAQAAQKKLKDDKAAAQAAQAEEAKKQAAAKEKAEREAKEAEEAKKTEAKNTATKTTAAQILQDARNIHTQATQVAGVQDKKVVVKAIAAAQTAIDQADAEKDNAQMCTVKAESAKALAQNALNIAQTAAPKRANKKADAERIFNEAKKLLQDAQSIVEVQDDATVKTAIDHASKTLALAQHAHAGTKAKTFKERASAALIAAQQAYNAAREAKQKFDSDQAAAKATATETANEEQGAKAKTIVKPKEDLAPGLDKLREKPMRDAKLHGRKRKKRDLSGILIKTPVEEANNLIQEINDIANGIDSTETIKQQAATAKLEFETLKNTVDKDDQQIILNRITDLRTQVLRAAAAEKKHKEIMQENKAKLTQQKAAGANALPGMIAEAKALFDALNAMPANTPKYNKIGPFGKALELAKINVGNNYDALRLAQDNPTNPQAAKGANMQKKKLEEIKTIYKEIYDKYKTAGGNLDVAQIPAP